MRLLVILAGLVTIAVLLVPVGRAIGPDPAPPTRQTIERVDRLVAATQMCQAELGRPRSATSRQYRRDTAAFAEWARSMWRARHDRWCSIRNWLNAYPPRAIEYVFSRLGADDVAIALDVADDEGGGPQCVRSTNGQYLGCFQMGDWARSTYGHGSNALLQAWAAFRYRVAARGWCSGWAATANVCPGAIP